MEDIRVLIEEEKIEERIKELAKQIEKDYNGKEIAVVCVLKGATYFTIELTKHIKNPITYEFIEISSYNSGTVSQGIKLNKDIKGSIEGKDVLVIEDIIDTGRTLSYLLKHLKEKGVNDIKLCTLISKPERREVQIDVDYIGFEIPNKFVLGCGLDVDERYRNIPYIGYIEE